MNRDEYLEISPTTKMACNIIMATAIVVCGIVLLILGVTSADTGIDIMALIAPVILATLGMAFLITSLMQHNTVTLYLSALLLVCSLASFLANLSSAVSYSAIWPLYIAAPAIASVVTMLMSKQYGFHIRIALVFGVLSIMFALFTAGIWGIEVLIPALIVYVGLIGLYATLAIKGATEE